MRVLVTGCTIRQCGEGDATVRHYATVFDMVEQALRLAGHQVTRRRVHPGEELDHDYDCALIGVHALASMASSRKFGAVWTATRLPHAVMFQDWKVRTTADHMHTETYLWKSSYLQGTMLRDFELAAPHAALMDRVRARWSRRMRHVILPMFPWADPEAFRKILRTVGEVRSWDVSPMLPPYGQPCAPFMRTREWICASLSNQTTWVDSLGATWPVARIFNGEKWKGGQADWGFVPEAELVAERYSRAWGVLMPSYGRECLPGWWRSRPHFAAQAGAIVWADPSEGLGALGDQHDMSLIDVERLDYLGLTQLAVEQRQALARSTATREEAAERLSQVLAASLMDPVR